MTCPVIFRDSDDNKQEGNISYDGFLDDRYRFIVTRCCILDLLESEIKSGDMNEDVACSIALNENLQPYKVIVDCRKIDFELEEVTEIKCKAA